MKREDLKTDPKIAVEVNNLSEAKTVGEWAGRNWSTTSTILGCVNLYTGFQAKIEYYKGDNYKIISFKEFEQQYLNDKPVFKKGDYIVTLKIGAYVGNCGKDNYCFKVRETHDYLRPEVDLYGSTSNGSSVLTSDRNSQLKDWRYATSEEIKEYDRLGKPYDVTILQKKDEHSESWCVKTTPENRAQIIAYGNGDFDGTGNYYGIQANIKRHSGLPWDNLLTTEQFYQKIGYTPKLLVGRYLRALKDNPQCIKSIRAGDYLQIVFIDFSGRSGKGKDTGGSTWSFNYNKETFSTWELMPEGFNPKEDVAYTKEALLEEVKKRYPVGTKVNCARGNKQNHPVTDYVVFTAWEKEDGQVSIYTGTNCWLVIHGKWAEIVKQEEMTIENCGFKVGEEVVIDNLSYRYKLVGTIGHRGKITRLYFGDGNKAIFASLDPSCAGSAWPISCLKKVANTPRIPATDFSTEQKKYTLADKLMSAWDEELSKKASCPRDHQRPITIGKPKKKRTIIVT